MTGNSPISSKSPYGGLPTPSHESVLTSQQLGVGISCKGFYFGAGLEVLTGIGGSYPCGLVVTLCLCVTVIRSCWVSYLRGTTDRRGNYVLFIFSRLVGSFTPKNHNPVFRLHVPVYSGNTRDICRVR